MYAALTPAEDAVQHGIFILVLLNLYFTRKSLSKIKTEILAKTNRAADIAHEEKKNRDDVNQSDPHSFL